MSRAIIICIAAVNNVRMLTIGHSFGGLITYEALGGEFIRVASRSRSGGGPQ